MPIEEQRRLKRGHVEGVLQRIGGFEAPVVLDAVGTAEVRGKNTGGRGGAVVNAGEVLVVLLK